MRLARIGDSSWASATFMVVCRAKRSAIWLAWVGSRCWTTTNAKAESAGISLKNSFNESIPPAEAPMPTTRTLETGSSILLHASLAHGAKSRGFFQRSPQALESLWLSFSGIDRECNGAPKIDMDSLNDRTSVSLADLLTGAKRK